MSWNIVLNKFVEIKNDFVNTFGADELWDYSEKSCLEYWVERLDKKEYADIIAPLQLNEANDLLLIRYGQFSDVFSGESEYEYADFWDMFDGFYMECRSIVLNIKKDEIVLCPFRKFRNINECEENRQEKIAERIKVAKCVEVTEKIDGSMQSARWYDGRVVMAGSQAVDVSNSFRLEEGYKMIEVGNYKQFLKDTSNYTSIFEYISLKDQHIVKYTEADEGLYLIGMRNVNTGIELPYKEVMGYAEKYELRTTKAHNKTLDEIMASLGEKKSDEAEGFVMNIDGYKVKIKYNDYVAMHGILSALSSPNLIIRNIADDHWDDFISKVPDAYKERVYETANKVFRFIKIKESKISELYNELLSQGLTERKEIMIWIEKNIEKSYRSYVRLKYLKQSYNLIRNKSGHYLLMKDINKYLEDNI